MDELSLETEAYYNFSVKSRETDGPLYLVRRYLSDAVTTRRQLEEGWSNFEF